MKLFPSSLWLWLLLLNHILHLHPVIIIFSFNNKKPRKRQWKYHTVFTYQRIFVSTVTAVIASIASLRQRNTLLSSSGAVKLRRWITPFVYWTTTTPARSNFTVNRQFTAHTRNGQPCNRGTNYTAQQLITLIHYQSVSELCIYKHWKLHKTVK